MTTILDPEQYSINNFMLNIAKEIEGGSLILDVGAGKMKYKKYFEHTEYETCDYKNMFYPNNKYTYICSAYKIPVEAGKYDAVINTQVLEHLEEPLKALVEMRRILRNGGKLYLTAPQQWCIHHEPYHYYNFTKYGLEYLFKKAGYKILYIKPRGGAFWYFSKFLSMIPSIIRKRGRCLYPIYLISYPIFKYIIPLILFPLDWLDKEKKITLGYYCCCEK